MSKCSQWINIVTLKDQSFATDIMAFYFFHFNDEHSDQCSQWWDISSKYWLCPPSCCSCRDISPGEKTSHCSSSPATPLPAWWPSSSSSREYSTASVSWQSSCASPTCHLVSYTLNTSSLSSSYSHSVMEPLGPEIFKGEIMETYVKLPLSRSSAEW